MNQPDYGIWDQFQELTPDKWAYLWCELGPLTDPRQRPAKVTTVSNMLYHATERGELPFRDTGGRHVFDDGTSIFEWGETYISRSALKKWCAAKGFCPKCLFPEERHESSDKDQRAKGDIKLPWNVKREKDDWVPAIKEAGQTLLEELGRIPNSAQVWIRLIENPPHGYGIKRDGDILTIPTAPPLSRKEFETRWRNYTEVEDKDA